LSESLRDRATGGTLALPRGVPALPRIRVVGLFVVALLTAGCTSSVPSSSPSPALSPSSPPAITTPSVSRPFTSVGPVQLVSRTFGVAAVMRCPQAGGPCRSRLFATQDLGRTWTDLMPPMRPGMLITSLFFLDEEYGWVVASECEMGRARLLRTVDGGRTWVGERTEAPDCHAGSTVQPEFVDPLHGWLLRRSFVGEYATLRRTSDGGRSWTKARDIPAYGDVTFADLTHGWLTTYDTHGAPVLMRTLDGGRSWSPSSLPAPSCCAGWDERLGVPAFFGPQRGVMPITLGRSHHTVLAFDTTEDGGERWSETTLRPFDGSTLGFSGASVSVVGPEVWWAIAGTPGTLRRTVDGGLRWLTGTLPDARTVGGIQAIDGQRAWVVATSHASSTLFVTRDDGRDWDALDPWALPGHAGASAKIRTMLPLPGAVTALTAAPDGIVYATSFADHAQGGVRERIVRFDPSTGSSTASVRVGGGRGWVERLAFAGGSVWLASGDPPRGPDAHVLYRFDATTVAIEQRIRLAWPPTALASVPAGLWVAAGRHLELVDPATSATIRSVDLPGRARRLAASPDGSRLYLTTDAPIRHDHTPLLELDAATGTVLASSWQGFADLNGVSGLTATDEGVWVTTPTGMMASLTFLRSSDLRQTATFEPAGSNGLRAYVAGPTLWVVNLLGGYTCADPSTGAVRGYVGIKGAPSGTSAVVETPTALYVGADDGIARIVPPPVCLAG
jgi:photosystem II stability/assembly factor-like uncharacterized protein